MRIHVLQHAPFEDIGSMALWFESHEAEVKYTRFFQDPALPSLTNLDLIVSMGGPMSANDQADFPWLQSEKQFVRDAISHGVSVLGVCLGAQIIASAMNARVYRNSQKEIGWFPIEAPSTTKAFQFPSKALVFHWHAETFDLPPGSVHLARSAGCENQAFQIGKKVIGLQFHPEMTPQALIALLENCGGDVTPGPYVQTDAELRKTPESTYADANGLMAKILSYLAGSKGR